MFRVDNLIGDYTLSKGPRKPRKPAGIITLQKTEVTKVLTVIGGKGEKPKEKRHPEGWKEL